MADTTTDMKAAVQAIADANNIMQENDRTIATQEERKATLLKEVEALEQNKKNLTEENNKLYSDTKTTEARKLEQSDTAAESIKAEYEKLEAEKAAIVTDRALIEAEKVQHEQDRGTLDITKAELEEAKAQLESRESESKRLTAGRDAQYEKIKKEKEALDAENKRNEVLKVSIEATTAENAELLAKIEQAREDAQRFSEEAHEEQKTAALLKQNAQQEQEAANFIKNESYRLTMIFRQALQTFVQMNGTTVAISELTDEHRLFIAKDLLSQMETPMQVLEAGTQGEAVEDAGLIPTDPMQDPKTYEKMAKPKIAEIAKEYKLDLNQEDTQKEMIQKLVDHIKESTTSK
jgi:hypothetical protein